MSQQVVPGGRLDTSQVHTVIAATEEQNCVSNDTIRLVSKLSIDWTPPDPASGASAPSGHYTAALLKLSDVVSIDVF